MATYTIPLKGDTTENWVASDRVLIYNEVGIEHDASGGVSLKVGDGVTGWNELRYVVKAVRNVVVTDPELTVTVGDNDNVTCQELTALSISEPSDVAAGYLSLISFTSGENATNFNVPWISLFSGDDCIDNVFTPLSNTRYNLAVQYDGAYITGLVAGFRLPAEDDSGDDSDNGSANDGIEDSPIDEPTEENPLEDEPVENIEE